MILRQCWKGKCQLSQNESAVGASALAIATLAALGLHCGIAVNALSRSHESWWQG